MTHETEREWPKWVTPHESRVVRRLDGQVSVPGFAHYQARGGAVTVLVHSEEEVVLAESALEAEEEIEHGD